MTKLKFLLIIWLVSYSFLSFTGYSNTKIGKIVFYSNRSGTNQIYTINADGTEERQLTKNFINEYPSWSPDGRKIIFSSEQNGRSQIYIMNSDGTNQKRLFTSGGDDIEPVFAPDSQKIVFVSKRDGGEYKFNNIYLYDIKSSKVKQLTFTSIGSGFPSCSPNGEKIVYTSSQDSRDEMLSDIYVMDADGKNKKRLTFDENESCGRPSWSPDGKKIIYMAFEGIFQINADGTGKKLLIASSRNHRRWDPSWSPDGKQIVFAQTDSDRGFNIYVMNSDGTGVRQITKGKGNDLWPSWSPY